MSRNLKYGLFALLIAFSSCAKEVEKAPDMGYDYFPTEQGLYISYEVQTIIWDDNDQSVDTTYYQVKMVIDTMFNDNMNRPSYRWNRFLKTDTTDWVYDHTYAITKTTDRLETVEGNNRYVKLAFPVRLGNHWDENAFNIKEKLETKYIDIDAPRTINGKSFDKCAIALMEDNISLVNEYYQEEIYAKGVGLVQRTDIHIDKEFTGEITKGYKHIYKIYEYGKE